MPVCSGLGVNTSIISVQSCDGVRDIAQPSVSTMWFVCVQPSMSGHTAWLAWALGPWQVGSVCVR